MITAERPGHDSFREMIDQAAFDGVITRVPDLSLAFTSAERRASESGQSSWDIRSGSPRVQLH